MLYINVCISNLCGVANLNFLPSFLTLNFPWCWYKFKNTSKGFLLSLIWEGPNDLKLVTDLLQPVFVRKTPFSEWFLIKCFSWNYQNYRNLWMIIIIQTKFCFLGHYFFSKGSSLLKKWKNLSYLSFLAETVLGVNVTEMVLLISKIKWKLQIVYKCY